MDNEKIFFLAIFLLFPIPSAFSAVSMNGTSITMDNSTIEINTPITVDELQVEGDGLTTRPTSSESLRKYTFYNTTANPTLVLSFIDIASTFSNFTRTTAGIGGLEVNVSGAEIADVKIDGTSGVWTFASSITNFVANAGAILQIIFDAIVVPPVGGGGGGGGSSTTIEIEIIAEENAYSLGQTATDNIIVKWDSVFPLTVEDITITDSVLGSIGLSFQDTPFELEGSSSAFSEGEVLYTVVVPPDECTTTIFSNCVDLAIYEVPVEFQFKHQGSTIRQDTVLPINLSGIVFPLSLPTLLILAGVGALFVLLLISGKLDKRQRTGKKAYSHAHKSKGNSHYKTEKGHSYSVNKKAYTKVHKK